jgi:hypothetical protein
MVICICMDTLYKYLKPVRFFAHVGCARPAHVGRLTNIKILYYWSATNNKTELTGSVLCFLQNEKFGTNYTGGENYITPVTGDHLLL